MMKKTKPSRSTVRGIASRLIVGVMLLAIIGGVLTSCGSSSTKYTLLTADISEYDFQKHMTDENGLSAFELQALAKSIKESKNGIAIREGLVAALNGYNIHAADFDDSRIPLPGETVANPLPAQPEKVVDFAMIVLVEGGIETGNLLISADAKPETQPESSAESDSESDTDAVTETETATEAGTETQAVPGTSNAPKVPRLTRADIRLVVESLRSEVTIKSEYTLIDQLLRWIGIGFGWMIETPGFGSFILGTLYYAIALEILMLPLGIRQQQNSRKQASLRPREMAIRKKYKGRNDKATQMKLNEEIQKLYANEGYSPMAGCLPMLITMPFLIFLYYIVIDPMVYMMGASKDLSNAFLTFADTSRAAGGLGLNLKTTQGTIEVLSLIKDPEMLSGLSDFAFFTNGEECMTALNGMVHKIPDFTLFGINLGQKPELFQKPYVLMLVPVLTFLVYWGTGKITRKFTFQPMQQGEGNDPAQGCSTGMMNVMMPAMSAFFTILVPSAVGVYWMFKSIVGTIKQIILYKVMPLPTFTEEDYKAAEKELAGKDKNKPRRSGNGNPNVRSLHYIDDEDYEDEPPVERKKGSAKGDYVEPEEEETPRLPENNYSEGVTLKEDRPAPEKKAKADKKTPATSEETDANTTPETDDAPEADQNTDA